MMTQKSVIFVALFLLATSFAKVNIEHAADDKDFSLFPSIFSSFGNFTTFVQALNYPVETHLITTEDGYILTFFRIQAKNQTSLKSGLPVVYLQHGFLDSADTWVINDESDAPGLQLANQGYDVWLGNSRGNKYSLSHVTLNSSNPLFWQFSWQNMSQYDLPAAFSYINQQTSQMINYIGHSQGTTIMFAALSQNDTTVMNYLKSFVALSPVAWVAHITSGPMLLMADTPLATIFEDLKIEQFFAPNFLSTEAGHLFCTAFASECVDFLQFTCGADPTYDNAARFGIFMEYFPAGTSLMDALHWKQEVETARFDKYDYGTTEDMIQYGQPSPPDYDLSHVTFPLHLFFAQNDALVDPTDTQVLLTMLKANNNVNSKEYPGTGHVTWLWGKDISFYFNDLLAILSDN